MVLTKLVVEIAPLEVAVFARRKKSNLNAELTLNLIQICPK
jgi:hypothetical protein